MDRDEELARARFELRERENALAKDRERLAALKEIQPWGRLPSYRLERNETTRLHKLREALRDGYMIRYNQTLAGPDEDNIMSSWFEGTQAFVVQHDWAAAFKGATDFAEGTFNLPFPVCAFEFRVSGRPMIVIATQPTPEEMCDPRAEVDFDGPHFAMPFVQCNERFWYCPGNISAREPAMQFAWSQIRAICIALDAEVAAHEIVRAPAALNEKRERSGKPLIPDYRVVKLHGRVAHQGAAGGGSHTKKRLHFRRGHWRHYETHNTWIRWMLVGDPDLGFVDKHYRI